jgi:bifunctional DNA primase/polymerase-like protein
MVSDWRTEESDATIEVGAAAHAALSFTATADLATLRVFPVKGKRPLMKGWQNVGPIDMRVVIGWQEKYPGCNWGVALDADTLVVDCDSEAATSALYDAGEPLGGIPATLTTMTGRGFHFWFRTPVPVHNRVALMPGVDARGRGGLVVVPPSVHQNGTHYQFIDLSAPIADAPDWLLRLVTGTADVSTSANLNIIAPGTHNARNALTAPMDPGPESVEELSPFEQDIARRGWKKRIGPGKVPDGRAPFALRIALEPQTVAKGTRNAALFAYLCRLRHDGKPEDYIREEAWRVVSRIREPMSRFEVERIIANAMKFDGRAVGSNTLVEAWRTVEQIEAGPDATKWYRFLLLVEQLAEMRPNTRPSILLPVRSIGTLMNAHFTQVAKWRRRAIEMGILTNTARYVRRTLADEFAVKAGFSPLADGPALFKVKRGRRPKPKPIELDRAA